MATIVSRLPEADGFALAGAGALVLHGYIDRETRDLDYFTTPAHQAGTQQLGAALEAALVNEGLESLGVDVWWRRPEARAVLGALT